MGNPPNTTIIGAWRETIEILEKEKNEWTKILNRRSLKYGELQPITKETIKCRQILVDDLNDANLHLNHWLTHYQELWTTSENETAGRSSKPKFQYWTQ